MTNPMPTGCVKEKDGFILFSPCWLNFNIFLETVDLDDSSGHLFIVDIFFDEKKNATEKQLLYNEFFSLILEKQKTLDARERSL